MILNSFISGLVIGLSLIMAIGAQNTFVFRQGLLGEYVWISILFCTFSDGVLIFAGTYGIGALITPYFEKIDSIIFLLTALWVGSYGLIRLHSAFFYSNSLAISTKDNKKLYGVVSALFLMTWLNPHVYLDLSLIHI